MNSEIREFSSSSSRAMPQLGRSGQISRRYVRKLARKARESLTAGQCSPDAAVTAKLSEAPRTDPQRWTDRVRSLPSWYLQAIWQLAEIQLLTDDYDGQDSLAPDEITVCMASAALQAARAIGCEVTAVAPGADGTISIEFGRRDTVAELEAYPTGRFAAWIDRPGTQTEFWGVPGNQPAILDAVQRIAARLAQSAE